MKMAKVFFILMAFGNSCYAANIRDLDVGDGVYLQGVLSDELVYIVRIDYQRNRVKIRRSEDGTVKWVRPSDLISREDSIGNDIGRAAIAIGVFACIANPDADACKSKNNSKSGSLSGNKSSKIYIVNDCIYDVKLAIYYQDESGASRGVGWWGIDGKKSTYLKFTNGNYATTNSSTIYYYAESTGGSVYWGGDINLPVQGRKYGMRKVVVQSGDISFSLSCPTDYSEIYKDFME